MFCINNILYFDILAPPPTTTQNRLIQSNKFSCVGKANGFYPNPYSCDSYYICVSQISSEVHCARGLLYNIKTKFCDWPQNVQCVNQQPIVSSTVHHGVQTTNNPFIIHGPTKLLVFTNAPVKINTQAKTSVSTTIPTLNHVTTKAQTKMLIFGNSHTRTTKTPVPTNQPTAGIVKTNQPSKVLVFTNVPPITNKPVQTKAPFSTNQPTKVLMFTNVPPITNKPVQTKAPFNTNSPTKLLVFTNKPPVTNPPVTTNAPVFTGQPTHAPQRTTTMAYIGKITTANCRFRFMVFNTTFNNISAISWRSVLLVEEIRVPMSLTNFKVVSSTIYN